MDDVTAGWPPAARAVYEGLQSYRIVGASACVEAIAGALEAIAAASPADPQAAVADAGAAFCALKPSTAAYANVVRWLVAGEDTAERAAALRRHRAVSLERIAGTGAALVADHGGALVHDYSSTVLAILERCEPGLPVVVTSGEPIGQGVRVARTIHGFGHRVTFVPDTAIARHLPGAGLVLSGVETLFSAGDLANTVGTYPIALVAREAGVPFYGATECMKIHPEQATTTIPDLDAALLHPWPAAVGLPPGTHVATEVLDLTPAELVTGYITERGVLAPHELHGALEQVFAEIA